MKNWEEKTFDKAFSNFFKFNVLDFTTENEGIKIT